MEQHDEFDVAEVRRIKLKIDCATLLVKETEEEKFSVDLDSAVSGNYNCTLEDGKLKVKYKVDKVVRGKKEIHDTKVIVKIPKHLMLDKMKVELGAGDAELVLNDTSFTQMALEVGAAHLNGTGFQIKENLSVELGAGVVRLENVTAQDAALECGVGKLYYTGSVEHNLNAECGVGSMHLNLSGNEQDYNYDISCGLGSIQLNENTMKHIGANQVSSTPNAKGTVKLSCGLGKIVMLTA